MIEAHIFEELYNIYLNGPVFPGNTLAHYTVQECEDRGWVRRNSNGDLVVTSLGSTALREWITS